MQEKLVCRAIFAFQQINIFTKSSIIKLDLIHLTGLTQTVKEPVLKESGPDELGGLRVDWGLWGFWEFQREALFDIRILNADASFDSTLSLESLFNKHRDGEKGQV